MERGFAVIGLGYVGLPVALALAKKFEPGHRLRHFQAADRRVAGGEGHHGRGDRGGIARDKPSPHRRPRRAERSELLCRHRADPDRCRTPPRPCAAAERLRADRPRACRPGSVVVFESTVYPGLTREICGPLLAKASGLRQGVDFKLGYSPERINPGDKQHRLETIVKIVAGEDAETLERVAAVYGADRRGRVSTGPPRIEVAEAAKVIENTQRDLNIALMNELAIIFDRLGIPTKDVLAGRRHEMEFPALHPGPGRRALHRGRSLLPDRAGRGGGLLPAGHPLRPAHQ